MIGRPGSAVWLLGWEIRLAWRELAARYGRRGLAAWIPLGLLLLVALAAGVPLGHLFRHAPADPPATWIVTADLALLTIFLLMLSQTVVAAADTLYERGDLDLLFASPLPPRRAISVRFAGVALNLYLVFAAVLAPVLASAAVVAGVRWLAGLLVLAALALAACALGLALAMGLFALIGPRRARTTAQVGGALVGAAFFLATQARLLMDERSRGLWRELWDAAADGRLRPAPILELPVRALMGQAAPLATLFVAGAGLFLATTAWLGGRFAADAAAAKGAAPAPARAGAGRLRFAATAFAAVWRKELRLLVRDPQLLSQVLLRVLYLVPVTLLLARSASRGEVAALPGAAAMVAFMAGQVAGSLAWITMSAEEAPDLLACAPTPIATVRRGKIAAALAPVAVLLAVPLAVVAALSPGLGLITLAGSAAAAACSALINLWQQAPARRSDFRRRRGASWYALWAEASVCGAIATATALAAFGAVWALAPAAIAVVLMLVLRRSDAQIAETLKAAS